MTMQNRAMQLSMDVYPIVCTECKLEFVLFMALAGSSRPDAEVSDVFFYQNKSQFCPYCGADLRESVA